MTNVLSKSYLSGCNTIITFFFSCTDYCLGSVRAVLGTSPAGKWHPRIAGVDGLRDEIICLLCVLCSSAELCRTQKGQELEKAVPKIGPQLVIPFLIFVWLCMCLLVCGIMCRSAGPCPSDFPSHFLLQVCGEYLCVSITCGAVPHPAETPWYCRGSQGNKRPVESVVTRQYFPYVIKLMWCWSSEHGHTGYHPKRMINYCISVGWVTCRHTRLILSLNIVDILMTPSFLLVIVWQLNRYVCCLHKC